LTFDRVAAGTAIAGEIFYPESDGRSMGEADIHRAWLTRLYGLLHWRYREQKAYVASNLVLLYEEGSPLKFCVPDVFVVLDCEPGFRASFKIWEEKRIPNVAIEVASRDTSSDDRVFKPALYARIGIREYFLYDPTGLFFKPALTGFRLESDGYRPIVPDSQGAFHSEELDLLFHLHDGEMVLSDRPSNRILETEAEDADRRADEQRQRADEERLRADDAERRAENESRARLALEEEVRRLKNQIESTGGGAG
jgi:Uma2 family endonuclease